MNRWLFMAVFLFASAIRLFATLPTVSADALQFEANVQTKSCCFFLRNLSRRAFGNANLEI